MATTVTAAGEASPQDQIRVIKAIESFGKGNAAAGEAWQKLVQTDQRQIFVILQAMDDASPLAQNWLRAAVDSIAERELRSGAKLPAAKLETFVKDSSHAARPRRTAFEWLTRIDPTAPDRLIPGMLNDRGLEFRRDAVARVMTGAEQAEKEMKRDEALKQYALAFKSARDIDQIKSLAEKLKTLGKPVDTAREMGYIMDWKLIGPFDNTALAGFDRAYPPEEKVDFAAKYDGKSGPVIWVDHTTVDPFGKVDFNTALGKANGVAAFAAAGFSSDQARDVDLRLGGGNACKIWLNGKLLASSGAYHSNDGLDQFVGHGRLNAGKNLILIKVCQNEQKESWAQNWEFQLRVCDAIGTPVLSTDRKPAAPSTDTTAQTR